MILAETVGPVLPVAARNGTATVWIDHFHRWPENVTEVPVPVPLPPLVVGGA